MCVHLNKDANLSHPANISILNGLSITVYSISKKNVSIHLRIAGVAYTKTGTTWLDKLTGAVRMTEKR